MSDRPLKVTFHLDGTGVYYDPYEPTHLDGLLGWCLAAIHAPGDPPRHDEEPVDIPLPLHRWHIAGHWGWHASALFPDGGTQETLQYWRCKFRDDRVDLTSGTLSHVNSTTRDYQTPFPLLLCARMVGYAHGSRRRVEQLLKKNVKYLGRKPSMGKGRVVGIDVEWIEQDYSLVMEGKAMRHLPLASAPRSCRPRPPYWNRCGAIDCCEVGDEYTLPGLDAY